MKPPNISHLQLLTATSAGVKRQLLAELGAGLEYLPKKGSMIYNNNTVLTRDKVFQAFQDTSLFGGTTFRYFVDSHSRYNYMIKT